MKKITLTIMMIILCITGLVACSFSDDNDHENNIEADDEEIPVIEYVNGYEIAKHENFAGDEEFEKRDIYLSGTLTKFEDDHVYITDDEGYNWIFTCWNNNHSFSEYVGTKCECYCKAEGMSSMEEDTVIIDFEENDDYKIIFENNEIYSEYDNCTMHNSYDEPYIAFGGNSDDDSAEYHIFDLCNNMVRNIQYVDNQWYYADANYEGLVFHRVEARYSKDFSGVYEIINDNSDLRYFINGGTGVLAPRQDYKELNMMMDVLIKNGDAKKVSTAKLKSDEPSDIQQGVDDSSEQQVWIPSHGGTKYHSKASCSSMIDPVQITLKEAQERGYEACGRCR